jgi:4-amino-4-deoxy-L-arabinose transferase-like glycosyltransferase
MIAAPFLNRGLFETSEGRYAMVAKTMNETGNFWIPQLNGKEHLTKPPLTYWIIALGQKTWGMNTFGSRINHMLIWLMFILLMVRIGELVGDEETGLLTGFIISSSLYPALGSWFLTTDPIMVFFQAIAFWALLEYKRTRAQGWTYIFWISLALAFNTKGPVALFPLIFWAFYMKDEVRKSFALSQLLFFIVGCSFWYIALEVEKSGILMQLLHDELIKRSTTDFSGRNAFWWAPFVTYFLPMIIGWGFWPFFVKKSALLKTIRSKEFKFFACWISITLIVFSFIQSRLILYMLPLIIPFSLIIAHSIKGNSKVVKVFILNVLLILTVKTVADLLPYDSDAKLISSFATSKVKEEKIYFLNEYLYGVEFYLGKQFERFTNKESIFRALRDQTPIRWVMYQEKRKDILDRIIATQSKKVAEHHRKGKWHLVRIEELKQPRFQELSRQ